VTPVPSPYRDSPPQAGVGTCFGGGASHGVSAKDAFLYIAGAYGDHANRNIEFGGATRSSKPKA
jgi:hypothetical protein